MAINNKNKNRAIVDGKEYLWWVIDEYDQHLFDGVQLKIVSSDQSHSLYYGLQQDEIDRMICISLRDSIKSVYLKCPRFEDTNGIITRSGIVRIIQWSKKGNHQILSVFHKNSQELETSQQLTILKVIQNIMEN